MYLIDDESNGVFMLKTNFYAIIKNCLFICILFCVIVPSAQGKDQDDELFWQRKFLEYLTDFETLFDRTNDNYAVQHFIESYAVRAMLVAFDNYTNDRYDLNYAIRWADRMLSLQGKTLNPGAYSMGYDETGYERPYGWYPADCCCVGLAVLAVATNSQIVGADRDRYINSVKMFVDYAIEEWRNPNGSLPSGWRHGELNHIPEFWIGTSLFSALTWHLYDVTSLEKYKTVAMEACDWLLDFDYKNAEVTPGTSFEDGITTFVLYLGEGLIVNAEHLQDNDNYYPKIKSKLRSLVDLVLDNQRPDGGMDCRVKWWRQKIPAMSLILNWYYRNMEDDDRIQEAAQKILQYTFSDVAELEIQTGIHTQTQTFTFLALAGKCVPGAIFPRPNK